MSREYRRSGSGVEEEDRGERGECAEDGDEIEIAEKDAASNRDAGRRDTVGIAQCACVEPAGGEGDEEGEERDEFEQEREEEALLGERATPDDDEDGEGGEQEDGEILPDEMEARMAGPAGIGGVGPVEVDREGGDALQGAEQGEEFAGNGAVIHGQGPFGG